jgi:membrane-associated phospholipid phosphatase
MASPIAHLDARIFFAIYAARDGAFAGLARALSAIGSGWIMLALVPLYAVRRWRRLALALTAAVAGSALLVVVLKLLVGRVRPFAALDGVHALCAMPTDPSFPSGHACGSFTVGAFALVILWSGRALRGVPRALVTAAIVSLAIGIAWSRVYLGVHFPGDVVAGALLGMMSGGLAGWCYRELNGFAPNEG